MILPDINVWIAISFSKHLHHVSATAWFQSLNDSMKCHFCRLTQQGFLRISNNPKMSSGHTASQSDSWLLYDSLLSNPRVAFANEPIGLESVWRSFTRTHRFSPNVWSDAYLASFAITGNFELVTFDQGFMQYPGLICTILK